MISVRTLTLVLVLLATFVAGALAVTKVGTRGADVLRGTAAADVLRGGPGKDRIFGRGGRDRMFGGVGNDLLDGGSHADVLSAGPGNDLIKGGRGNDRANGGAGNDRIFGHAGRDRLDGGAGRDRIDGGPHADVIVAGAGNDVLIGRGGRDRFVAGPGNDRIYARDRIAERISCGTGTDRVVADANDVASADCEVVARPPVVPPPTPPPTPPPAPPSGPVVETTLDIPVPAAGLVYAVTEATAPAGRITLRSVNPQAMPHNIALGAEIGAIVTDGGVSEITVTLTPGTYEYFCSVPGHREAGMVGTLIVT